MLAVDCITCGLAFEPKNKEKGRWLYISGMIALNFPLMTVKFLFNNRTMLRDSCIFAMVATTLLIMHFFFEGFLWQKLLFRFANLTAGFIAELLTQVAMKKDVMQIGHPLTFYEPLMLRMDLTVSTINALLYILCLVIHKRFFCSKIYNLRIYLVFCIFPVSQILLMMSTNTQIYDGFSESSVILIAGAIAGIMADILLLYALNRQQKMQDISEKFAELENAWETEQNHYREIESRRESLAKIRHDLNEHLIIIRELLQREEYVKAYAMLDTLTEYVASTREYVYCGDPVVNAVMAENEKLCREKQIALQYDFNIPVSLKLDPVSICSLFSNLMRNAVAAAEKAKGKCPEGDYVTIRAAVRGNYLHIIVDNSRIQEPSKGSKRKRYGKIILQELVEKYNGQMEIAETMVKYHVEITVENESKE